jgi:transposase
MFIGDVGAGQRSATLYSLLGSCLRRGINPRAYLHWLFDRLPSATNRTVHTLTPAAYAALTDGRDKVQVPKAA